LKVPLLGDKISFQTFKCHFCCTQSNKTIINSNLNSYLTQGTGYGKYASKVALFVCSI
jgi:hypothetical protein